MRDVVFGISVLLLTMLVAALSQGEAYADDGALGVRPSLNVDTPRSTARRIRPTTAAVGRSPIGKGVRGNASLKAYFDYQKQYKKYLKKRASWEKKRARAIAKANKKRERERKKKLRAQKRKLARLKRERAKQLKAQKRAEEKAKRKEVRQERKKKLPYGRVTGGENRDGQNPGNPVEIQSPDQQGPSDNLFNSPPGSDSKEKKPNIWNKLWIALVGKGNN